MNTFNLRSRSDNVDLERTLFADLCVMYTEHVLVIVGLIYK